jgi:hypothetical protein
MAFRQYTSCEQPGDYVDFSFNAIGIRNILILVLSGGFGAWLIAVFVGGPLALMAAVALFVTVVAYLVWWLHHRLICLGGDRCLVGVVRSLGPANPLEKAGDNDFSMNILLAPGPTALRQDFGANPAPPIAEYQTQVQGVLVSPQPQILAIGRTYVSDAGHEKYITALHCEFEGSGVRNLLIWASAVLAFLAAALAIQLLAPGFGWLASLLILIAIFLGGSGALIGLGAGPGAAGSGDPTDIDPELATLKKWDIVVLKGSWVYDSLHHGWNEIHPIKACCKIGETFENGPWPPELATGPLVETLVKKWCGLIDDCDKAEEEGSRDEPEHDWVVHPLVDGCRPDVIIT